MLNITENSISDKVNTKIYDSFKIVNARKHGKTLLRVMAIMGLAFVLVMVMPWTQNIRSNGEVTTLRPDQRPQTIHSVIAGRIEQWFVKEGDFVNKGDTIVFISEIKDEYFDPNLLDRTEDQLKSKEMSAQSYMEKVKALDKQIDAMVKNSKLNLQQARNKLKQAHLKVQSDSIDFEAAVVKYEIAQAQADRMQKLYDDGLKSLTDLEARKLSLQKANAEKISAENALLTSQNEVINAEVELGAIENRYKDAIAKAEAEKYTALSSMYTAEADVTKLQNQYMNYSVRKGMYYITSPQNGYVTKAIKSGIGETIKEGAEIVSIMPEKYDLAVQMYVRPIDLPLIHKGQEVRIQFDGWPAVVFSGWPNTSYGTFGGQVLAIDNFISPNGMYRLIVVPDTSEHAWPTALRVGAGTSNMLLLQDVPVWYEIWRKINGFPPNFYTGEEDEK